MPDDSQTQVPYNAAYETTKLETLKANIQAAYNNEIIRSGNRALAEKAAEAAANAGAQLIQIYGNQGLQALSQATQAGLGVADLLAKLQGPANAFAYDRAINGVNASGLSNAIGALTGSYRPPQFQGMGPTTPLTLDSMAGQTSGGSSGIIDQLLGISSNASQQQSNVQNGQLPFTIPQFDPSGSGNVTANGGSNAAASSTTAGGTVAPATVGGPATINNTNHFYGATPTGDTHSGFSLGTPQYSTDAQNYLNALPDPNAVNVRGYAHLDPYSQSVAMSGYAAKGYSPEQLQNQFANKLPQFGSPRVGLVS